MTRSFPLFCAAALAASAVFGLPSLPASPVLDTQAQSLAERRVIHQVMQAQAARPAAQHLGIRVQGGATSPSGTAAHPVSERWVF